MWCFAVCPPMSLSHALFFCQVQFPAVGRDQSVRHMFDFCSKSSNLIQTVSSSLLDGFLCSCSRIADPRWAAFPTRRKSAEFDFDSSKILDSHVEATRRFSMA